MEASALRRGSGSPHEEWKGNNVLRHQQVRASGSFAQYLFSALAGRDDNEDLICLMRRAVNNPNVWFCERRALSQKRVGYSAENSLSIFIRGGEGNS
jgi:hypothetical protein